MVCGQHQLVVVSVTFLLEIYCEDSQLAIFIINLVESLVL